MKIEKNSRQMPAISSITREKDYCDLLYAWLQCNSERETIDSPQRIISKRLVKWTSIEKDFTRTLPDGTSEKTMARKTIAKYFKYLEDKGLIKEGANENYYYLTTLDAMEANLIEYNTLSKLMNVMQKNSINIYMYLFNRFFANAQEGFETTMRQIKDFIGIASGTTSNNVVILDTLEILERLGLLSYKVHSEGITVDWVRNKLPELTKE